MALKDLLVIVDDTPQAAARIAVAASLAARHEAHLTGLYIRPLLTIPRFVEMEMPEEIRERSHRYLVERVTEAQTLFEETAHRYGCNGRAEWRVAEGAAAEVAAIHGHYADLIVVGQRDASHDMLDPEDLLFSSGRPLLVVPAAGTFATVGERVILAWNASREAARAAHDGLAVLETARKVTVLAINPPRGRHGMGDEPGADIARHLSRHGVVAEAQQVVSDALDPGALLLNAVADSGADLVVMGAYGRSRLRELVLGGMTHYVLSHMTVPVLMSH